MSGQVRVVGVRVLSQANLGTAHPIESNKPGRNKAKTKGPAKRELPGSVRGLLGSAGRIAAYAGVTAAIGLAAVAIALLGSGILAI